MLLNRATYFAISARRVHEIMKIHPDDLGDISESIAPNAQALLSYEPDYWKSINRLIHAHSSSVVITGTNKSLFAHNENKAIGGIDVTDATGQLARINLYGLALDFLCRVSPMAMLWLQNHDA